MVKELYKKAVSGIIFRKLWSGYIGVTLQEENGFSLPIVVDHKTFRRDWIKC